MTETIETLAASEAEGAARRARGPAAEWWLRLADPYRGNPGVLAKLRRARSSVEAMLYPESIDLARRLGAMREGGHAPDARLRSAIDLSRVLAHVKEDDAGNHPMRACGWRSFPGGRKESDAGDERPKLAEARFRRLMQTGDGEDRVIAFKRLVAMLGDKASVDDIASDFVDWNHPERGPRVRERWAFLYYAAGKAAPRTLLDSSTVPSIDQESE